MSDASSSRPIRIGVQVSALTTADEWVTRAREAEDAGFASFLVPDHLFPTAAPITALAVTAAVTSRIKIGTLLLNNDFRNPVVLAHEAATLDVLSGGRLELGLGAGWNEKEYNEAGIEFDPPKDRVDRLIESVSIVKKLLSGEHVEVNGSHYTVNHELKIATTQQPRPRMIIGGNGNRVLSLAARESDIVSLLGVTVRPDGTRDFSSFTSDGLQKKIDVIRRAAEERFDDLELSSFVWNVTPGDNAEAAAAGVDRPPDVTVEDMLDSPFGLFGTPAEMAEKILRVRERFGISYWVVPLPGMETTKAVIRELAGQ